ncbi:uncharacterized protein BO95DRAFT_468768 [Aspergillus brunneoviolaceus CBS 621.78]|uniref:Uncharacterized protein n=1 Tax=Aspergillus brunneoviolaceus CBS 621.78 TaxID=1450534 RepID=A0ACD1FU77_9EURO|nr:hypothetical protein BO95DRAFT_468768 [Aspergillus brunneoviolaceus CBS 621.78]RAH40470.1 hypothetical protein BO95DRAFT_468768 [Aspergillus brunneoviolaceus CBS 621.78]
MPKTNKSDVKEFHVNVDDAKAQAKAAGFTTGKRGDPHDFKNIDKIQWGVKGCNKLEADMYEYPIFWEGAKVKQWKKDEKTSDQGKTPIRVVYVQTKDKQLTFCGVMIHVDVLANYQGEGFLAKCNP